MALGIGAVTGQDEQYRLLSDRLEAPSRRLCASISKVVTAIANFFKAIGSWLLGSALGLKDRVRDYFNPLRADDDDALIRKILEDRRLEFEAEGLEFEAEQREAGYDDEALAKRVEQQSLREYNQRKQEAGGNSGLRPSYMQVPVMPPEQYGQYLRAAQAAQD